MDFFGAQAAHASSRGCSPGASALERAGGDARARRRRADGPAHQERSRQATPSPSRARWWTGPWRIRARCCWSASLVGGFIGIASFTRILQLREGGGYVARSLGGVRVERSTPDPRRRQLHNVVEEMALAVGRAGARGLRAGEGRQHQRLRRRPHAGERGGGGDARRAGEPQPRTTAGRDRA